MENNRPSAITHVYGALNGELDQKNTDSSTHASNEVPENSRDALSEGYCLQE